MRKNIQRKQSLPLHVSDYRIDHWYSKEVKIVDAHWEIRNLGVTCIEVEIEEYDSLSQIQELLASNDSQYIVIKVPTSRSDLIYDLQDSCLKFVETLTICSHQAIAPILEPIYLRVLKQLKVELSSEDELLTIRQNIRNGMFNTDRISLDYHFTEAQARNRYLGWLSDEIELGGKIYGLSFKSELAGFFTLRETRDGEYTASLAGVFPKFQHFGLGKLINYIEILETINLKGSRVTTAFSSSNRAAAAIHFQLGYDLKQQYYVFTRHKE